MVLPPAIRTLAVPLGALLLLAGCSGGTKELDLPPQTLTAAPTATPPPAPPAATAERAGAPPDESVPPVEDDPVEKARQSETIVIKTSESADVTPQSLVAASRAAREERAKQPAPVAVITNENLAQHAEGGQVTVAGTPGGAEETEAQSPRDPGADPEQYWRSRARELRQEWRDAADGIEGLEGEVATWRRRFYDEDDPYYRDNEIKPSWDRALSDLEKARARVAEAEQKLDDFLEEGRRAGALPGWLREGIELEPPRSYDEEDPAEQRRREDPREPKILNEEPIQP